MVFKTDLGKLIRSRKFDDFIRPRYDGLSIANLAPTIARLLDVNFRGRKLKPKRLVETDEEFSHVVLFVVDALGHSLLVRSKGIKELLDSAFPKGKAKRSFITSVFPSTTTAALTSMFTGLTPSEHGMLGYTLFLKEIGAAVNMIKLSPVNERENSRLFGLGFTPHKLLPYRKLTEVLHRSGVPSRFLIRFGLRGSGLSTLLYKRSECFPYITLSDMFLSLSRILHERRKGLTIVYWGGLDAMAHHYGPFSRETHAELSLFLQSMKGFLKNVDRRAAKGVLLMLTSDHGQAETKDEVCFRVDDIKWLKESLLMPPTGEGRCAYMYLRRDAQQFKRKFRTKLGKHFHLMDTKQSVSDGLFGLRKMPRENLERLGDVISVAKGNSKLLFTYNIREMSEAPFVKYGGHGGLTLNEMLVPLISAPLKALAI